MNSRSYLEELYLVRDEYGSTVWVHHGVYTEQAEHALTTVLEEGEGKGG